MNVGDLIDDYLAHTENVKELEGLEDSYEDVDETTHEVDHIHKDNVKKRKSGKMKMNHTIKAI